MRDDTLEVVFICFIFLAVLFMALNLYWGRTQRKICGFCRGVAIKKGTDIFFKCLVCHQYC